MATKKKGLLTSSKEWAKHLRKWGKRAFWKKERKESKINQAEMKLYITFVV